MLTAKLQLSASAQPAAQPAASAASGVMGADWEVRAEEDLDDTSCLLGDAAPAISAAGDVELRVARLELLIDRRPLLLSGVLLRQNPHNVTEVGHPPYLSPTTHTHTHMHPRLLQWHKRMKLLAEAGHTPAKIVSSFTEAVRTVDPWKAVGKPSSLWVAFAKYYESHKDLANARAVFGRASQADFRAVDDLAAVWCEWAELEIRAGNYGEALALMQRATAEPLSKRQRPGEERA